MNHLISIEDKAFKEQVEACDYPVSEFDHCAHVRLAYIYLVEGEVEQAVQRMKHTLLELLAYAGIDQATKYHETLTRAWILAVHHFINRTEESGSAADFINRNPEMLDSNIMMTHYSAEVLFSEKARRAFVEPNLSPIPGNGG